MKINIFWFRRDLRLEDNTALNYALEEGLPVLPVFIFDTNITEELPADDPRITFIYDNLLLIHQTLKRHGSSILVLQGDPVNLWEKLISENDINAVYINKDYEPYAISRDNRIEEILSIKNIPLRRYKDQVIFEENEIVKTDNSPYTVFTAYKNKWLKKYGEAGSRKSEVRSWGVEKLRTSDFGLPSLAKLGFKRSEIRVKPYDLSVISTYDKYRDLPAADKTSHLGPHLRFGTISIREIARIAAGENSVFLSELIWREFFMQILFKFPHVITSNFRSKYNNLIWRNNEAEFEKWMKGETGFPLVDAGMRELKATGYMHNRVRLVAAGFLCKHLLIDWRWGEAYFASKLLDYELASNNGNWQWIAGTGCDAAPYFRVFNPENQLQKFDHNKEYVKKWIPEFETSDYPSPMIDHEFARRRVIETYKKGLQ